MNLNMRVSFDERVKALKHPETRVSNQIKQEMNHPPVDCHVTDLLALNIADANKTAKRAV